MSSWRDRNDRPLDIGDMITYPKNQYNYNDDRESSRVIGYAGNGRVVVRGNFIDGPKIVPTKKCEKW